jgi:hypothetical protein
VEKIQKIPPFLLAAILIIATISFIIVLQLSVPNTPSPSSVVKNPDGVRQGTGTTETVTVAEKMVSIVAVSRQQEDGIIQISGMTDLPAGSGVMYEIWPANISTRKKTVEDVDGISGRTAASKGEGLTPWSITINITVWRPGKYIINAWPEESDPHYGDRKMFFIPLNDTVSNGLGKDSGTGEIILYAITPSEPSSLPVFITPKPTPGSR